MKEKLQEYALIAEIIGGVAIVISLIFVGLQIRQSNTLSANEALKDGTQIWVTAYTKAFGTEESTFVRKAVNNYQELNKDEQGRFFSIMLNFIAAFDNIYNQYQAGLLREEVFISIALVYYSLIRMPGARQLIAENVPAMPPTF